MNSIVYKLSPATKVREESFGLLFYNTKNTNLTFIESGRLISIETLEKESMESDYLSTNEVENQKIKGLLNDLVKRGLILATEKKSS